MDDIDVPGISPEVIKKQAFCLAFERRSRQWNTPNRDPFDFFLSSPMTLLLEGQHPRIQTAGAQALTQLQTLPLCSPYKRMKITNHHQHTRGRSHARDASSVITSTPAPSKAYASHICSTTRLHTRV